MDRRRYFLSPLTLAGVLSGCTSGVVDRWAESAHFELTRRPELQYVYVSCAGAPQGAACGLLADELLQPEARETFRERVCSKRSAVNCEAAFDRYVKARLGERYFAAKRDRVQQQCDAAPAECEELRQFETLLLVSHNASITVRRGIAASNIERDRARWNLQDMEATSCWFDRACRKRRPMASGR